MCPVHEALGWTLGTPWMQTPCPCSESRQPSEGARHPHIPTAAQASTDTGQPQPENLAQFRAPSLHPPPRRRCLDAGSISLVHAHVFLCRDHRRSLTKAFRGRSLRAEEPEVPGRDIVPPRYGAQGWRDPDWNSHPPSSTMPPYSLPFSPSPASLGTLHPPLSTPCLRWCPPPCCPPWHLCVVRHEAERERGERGGQHRPLVLDEGFMLDPDGCVGCRSSLSAMWRNRAWT